jgi:thiol-disulfide isomerase/thioredoxin
MVGLWVLLATLAVAATGGLVMRARDGRFRGSAPATPPVASAASVPANLPAQAAADQAGADQAGADQAGADQAAVAPPAGSLRPELDALGVEAGQRATLVQFSTAFCAPCRVTRRVLADVAARVPGVTHVEVDAESHLDLVRRLAIRRTPTVLVLDSDGRLVSRASGAPPSRDAVLAAVGAAVPAGHTAGPEGA